MPFTCGDTDRGLSRVEPLAFSGDINVRNTCRPCWHRCACHAGTAVDRRTGSGNLRQCRHRGGKGRNACRSEEHTSELQSLMRISYAVFCLKKQKKLNQQMYSTQ